MTVYANGSVDPINYVLPVASAQVKSAVLLAGLFCDHGMTVVEEPLATRDHTERMLQRAGVPIDRRPGRVAISPVRELVLPAIEVPGDFSSAAPFIVAATAIQGSNLTLRGIGINPTRTGLLAVMERMGAKVGLFRRRFVGRRAGGRHRGASGRSGRRRREAEQVPSLIDELPAAGAARELRPRRLDHPRGG